MLHVRFVVLAFLSIQENHPKNSVMKNVTTLQEIEMSSYFVNFAIVNSPNPTDLD